MVKKKTHKGGDEIQLELLIASLPNGNLHFWVRCILLRLPESLYMLSSRLLVCSDILVGLAGAVFLGSVSTMISKSTSFSLKEDISLLYLV